MPATNPLRRPCKHDGLDTSKRARRERKNRAGTENEGTMTLAEAKRNNTAQGLRLQKSIDRLVKGIAFEAVPRSLDRIGAETAAHARATHEYISRTGNLERSTTYAVVEPNSSGEFKYDSPEGEQSVQIANFEKHHLLIIGAGMPYSRFVELKNGFSVVINSILKLKHEFMSKLALNIRLQKLF
jgi:hypothetical protein